MGKPARRTVTGTVCFLALLPTPMRLHSPSKRPAPCAMAEVDTLSSSNCQKRILATLSDTLIGLRDRSILKLHTGSSRSVSSGLQITLRAEACKLVQFFSSFTDTTEKYAVLMKSHSYCGVRSLAGPYRFEPVETYLRRGAYFAK